MQNTKHLNIVRVAIILILLLTWNYVNNSFGSVKDGFDSFQQDSEQLVINRIEAKQQGKQVVNAEDVGYGLGKFDDNGVIGSYKSQYGLQGKFFCLLSGLFSEKNIIKGFHLICAFLTALVFTIITLLISRKYNKLMAICFFLTFLLSPWIVNFGRNLYWVEFTWFVPMLIGLVCSLHMESKAYRFGCCLLAFLTITIKCLCGYEYISTIMIGLIAFPLVDMFSSFHEKDKKRALLYFRTVVFLGLSALAGFAVAIIVHASLRGNGNISDGIVSIFKNDVLRRTFTTNIADYDPVYWESMKATVLDTCIKYFHFSTEIINGIPGNLFMIICLLPLVIFFIDEKNKKLNINNFCLYITFFLAAISWFCLAKSHSYIHTHISFVLWYFGFIQICFYIIADKISRLIIKRD